MPKWKRRRFQRMRKQAEKTHEIVGRPGESRVIRGLGSLHIVTEERISHGTSSISKKIGFILKRTPDGVRVPEPKDRSNTDSATVRFAWTMPGIGGGFTSNAADVEISGSHNTGSAGSSFALKGENIHKAPVRVDFLKISERGIETKGIATEVNAQKRPEGLPVEEGMHLLHEGDVIALIGMDHSVIIMNDLNGEQAHTKIKFTRGQKVIERSTLSRFGTRLQNLETENLIVVGRERLRISILDKGLQIDKLGFKKEPIWIKVIFEEDTSDDDTLEDWRT